MKVCVTGSEGFIGGYLVAELIAQGHEVVGIDDLSKYGTSTRRHDADAYRLVIGDVRRPEIIEGAIAGCDHLVAGAALIGGIEYFHRYPYDILASNEQIIASTCDAARRAHDAGTLQKVTYISSSMVYESADRWPSAEGDELEDPAAAICIRVPEAGRRVLRSGRTPAVRTAVHDRPTVQLRRHRRGSPARAREVTSGGIRLALSHVLPDLVQKVLRGQDPLHILGDGSQVRHYTYGGDLARGIVSAMLSPYADAESFNLSTSTATTVLELAELIWREVRGDDPLSVVSDPPYEHDVQMRVPDTSKAKDLLGFRATTGLPDVLAEVVPWIRQAIADGRI